MKMEIVDFSDPKFELCKNFLKGRMRGKGQSIEIKILSKSVEDFLNTKLASNISTDDPWFGPSRIGYTRYCELVMSAVKKQAQIHGDVYFQWENSGYWEGTERKDPILHYEGSLKMLKKANKFMSYVNFSINAFAYLDKFYINKDNKLTIAINKNGIDRYGDIEKLIKFLNILGYKEKPPIYKNIPSLIIFDDIDVDVLYDSKEIWDFLD